MSSDRKTGEIYLEFRQVGNQVQATAIDAATGIEVSVFGPISTHQSDLQRLAVRKLQRRLEQERAAQAGRDRDPTLY
jgi:hypothetical protein